MSDYQISITTIGDSTHIDYNGRRYVPWQWANQLMAEAVESARADERERIAQAIEAADTYDARKIPLGQDPETTLRACIRASGLRDAARIARSEGQP